MHLLLIANVITLSLTDAPSSAKSKICPYAASAFHGKSLGTKSTACVSF